MGISPTQIPEIICSETISLNNPIHTIIDLCEFLVGFFIAGVLVGMVLQRELPISSLDLILGGPSRNLQHIVIALPDEGNIPQRGGEHITTDK